MRNDLGLLSEEYDPRAKRQLGNFPQAFSHVALVSCARILGDEDMLLARRDCRRSRAGLLSAKGARQLEPGATPQECDSLEWPSAESAIHAFSEQLAVLNTRQ